MYRTFLFLFSLIVLLSCGADKDETSLTLNDREYIESLGILKKGEDIQLFESNGGFDGIKQSGNFITSERIASYWIEDTEQTIGSAFYSEIDSMTLTDLVSKLTYASYITVYKTDGNRFDVYIDADSARTYQFYGHALSNWEKNR